MKILYLGGVKSGKSRLAEAKTLQHSKSPVYLATTQLLDDEMKERIEVHKQSRSSAFTVVEEPEHIVDVVQNSKDRVLVECMSMWINNMLYYKHSKELILEEVKKLVALDREMVFVLNEVGTGIIGGSKLERDFVDISGITGQILAASCDEVYQVVAGIARQLK